MTSEACASRFGGDRRRQPFRVGADVDELVARHRDHRHPLAGHLVDGDHRRLEPAAAQVVLHLGGVLADQLDPDAGVPLEHVGDQPRAGVQAGDAEHAEPDRAGLEGLHALHRVAGPRRPRPAPARRAGAACRRRSSVRRRGRPGGRAGRPSDRSSARICSEIDGWA